MKIPLLLLFLAVPFALPCSGASGDGAVLFATDFSDPEWQADWEFDPDRWEVIRHKGDAHLRAKGREAPELVRAVKVPEGEDFGIHLKYGFLWGNGSARVSVILSDASGKEGVRVEIGQGAGEKKYRILRFGADGEKEIGAVGSEAVDTGAKTTGTLPSTMLTLEWSPDGRLMLQREGEEAARFQTDPFGLAQLRIRDDSAHQEAVVIASVRAYAGETPFHEVGEIGFPFGGCFVEGGPAPAWSVRLEWGTDKAREVSLEASVERDDGGEKREVAAAAKLLSGHKWEPDLGLKGLTPGLYHLRGRLTVGAMEHPVVARFAILAKELADRPDDEVPPWMGLVPQISRFQPEEIQTVTDFMHQLGVRHVRWEVGWHRIEPEAGVYDWGFTDQILDALSLKGFNIMGCLTYWGPAGRDVPGKMAWTPEGRAFWVDHYATPVFKRYGPRIKDWQIWNEPNAFWNEDPEKATGFAIAFGTPSNYYDLFLRSYQAGKRVSPDLNIMASLASTGQMESLKLLAGMGLLDHFDGLVVHTYGNHIRNLTAARQWMDENGFADKGIGVGEVGQGGADGAAGAEMQQTVNVPEVFLSSAGVKGVFGVDWFSLTDSTGAPGYGLLNNEDEPRLSAVAYHTVARLLSGASGGTSRTEGAVRIHEVQRTGRPPLTGLWVQGDAGSVRIGLRKKSGRQVDLGLGGETKWVELDGHPLLLEGDIEISMPLQMRMIPLPNGSLRIRWESGKPLDDAGKLTLTAEGLDPENQTLEVALTGRETEVEVPLKGATQGSAHRIRASWKSDVSGLESLADRNVEFTRAPKVTPEEALALTPPEGMPMWEVEDYVKYMDIPLDGPEDLSAKMALGWTDEHLVLWIDQTDDIWVPATLQPWSQDGPQFALDPANLRSPHAFYVEYCFGLGEDGPVAFVPEQPHYKPELLAKREGNKTLYRLLIPFADLNVKPEAGMPMGATLIINENDGKGREGWLSWGEGVALSKDPSLYRQFILAPPNP